MCAQSSWRMMNKIYELPLRALLDGNSLSPSPSSAFFAGLPAMTSFECLRLRKNCNGKGDFGSSSSISGLETKFFLFFLDEFLRRRKVGVKSIFGVGAGFSEIINGNDFWEKKLLTGEEKLQWFYESFYISLKSKIHHEECPKTQYLFIRWNESLKHLMLIFIFKLHKILAILDVLFPPPGSGWPSSQKDKNAIWHGFKLCQIQKYSKISCQISLAWG